MLCQVSVGRAGRLVLVFGIALPSGIKFMIVEININVQLETPWHTIGLLRIACHFNVIVFTELQLEVKCFD